MPIDKDERLKALKALIRETVASAGGIAPDAIPHRVKERLKGQALGDLNVDRLIEDALKERRQSGW
jgi:hypothetical protein